MIASFATPLWSKPKKGQTSNNEPQPKRPCTRLMLCGLAAGLSMTDMRSMRVCDVENIVAEHADMHYVPEEQEERDVVRDATPADFAMLKGL